MHIKKFEAPTIQEALDTIKRELGPQAIILQTKKNKKGFGLMSGGSFEVTAAVPDKELSKKTAYEKRIPEEAKDQLYQMPAKAINAVYDRYAGPRDEVPAKQPKGQYPSVSRIPYVEVKDARPAPADHQVLALVKDLQEKVGRLEKEAVEARSSGAQVARADLGLFSSEILKDRFEQLILNGLETRFAYEVCKKVAFDLDAEGLKSVDDTTDQVALTIMESTEVIDPLEAKRGTGPKIMAFIGATGVGKTTTVAKIASESALKRGMKVGLINLDFFRVGAVDQLMTYAKILKVPVKQVQSREQLDAAIKDFASYDLVIIDTIGRSQRDVEALDEQAALLENIPDLRSFLVVSATTRDREMMDVVNRYSLFHPTALIFSKLDEAVTYGSVYNLSHRAKLPLAYFTTGQNVPDDIEPVTAERVASLLMDL